VNGIAYALRSVHHGEQHLATELLKVAERHHADHEVHFGAREAAVLELVSACHPYTLRQLRWSSTLLKTLSPQVLSAL